MFSFLAAIEFISVQYQLGFHNAGVSVEITYILLIEF